MIPSSRRLQLSVALTLTAVFFGFQNCSPRSFKSQQYSSTAGSAPLVSPELANYGTAYYVSPQGNDSWSGRLPDPRGADGPFRTLPRAIEALKAASLSDGKVLLIRAGTYYLSEPIVLGPEFSGSDSKPTVIQNYNHERVVISGGVEVTGWQMGAGGVQKAPSPAAAKIADTFQNLRLESPGGTSTWASLSRWPKKSNDVGNPDWQNQAFWLYAKGTPQAGQYDANNMYLNTVLNAGDAAQLAQWDLGSAEITFFSLSYDVRHLPMGQLTNGAIFTLTGPYGPSVYPNGMRFSLGNIPGAISAPFEWAIDRNRGDVYFKPPAGNTLTGYKYIMSSLQNLITIQGTEQNFVKNLQLQGLEFADTSDTAKDYYPTYTYSWAVEVSYASNIAVRGNYFHHLGNTALVIRTKSQNVSVDQNVFAHIGQSAAQLMSSSFATGTIGDLTPGHVNIRGNSIYDSNHMLKGSGIMLYAGNDTLIEGNLLNNVGGPGIQLVGLPTATSARNMISRNDVFNTSYGVADSAGIYISSNTNVPLQNQVVYNRVLNTRGAYSVDGTLISPSGGVGVYLDNFESGVRVLGNIVSGSSSGSLFIHGGSQNSVSQNLFFNGGQNEMVMAMAGSPMSGNLITTNVIGHSSSNFFGSTAIWMMVLNSTTPYYNAMSCDGNFYIAPDPTSMFGANGSFYDDRVGYSSKKDFQTWRGFPIDTNSPYGGMQGDLNPDPAGNITGFAGGFLSSLTYGPPPALKTGLTYYSDTYVASPAIKTCLGALLKANQYDFSGVNMPDSDAIAACYAK